MEDEEIRKYLSLYENKGKLDEAAINAFLTDMGATFDIAQAKSMNSQQILDMIKSQQQADYKKEELIKIFEFYDKEKTGSVDRRTFDAILGSMA